MREFSGRSPLFQTWWRTLHTRLNTRKIPEGILYWDAIHTRVLYRGPPRYIDVVMVPLGN